MKEILFQALISFISSVSFAVLCHIPKKTVLTGGIIGMLGWLGYWAYLQNHSNIFIASFICALILATASYISSIIFKKPMIIFFVPGLVPVVPGITFYEGFRSLIGGEYGEAGFVFLNVMYCAVGIASGLILSFAMFQIYQKIVKWSKNRQPFKKK